MPLRSGALSARRFALAEDLPETFSRHATMAVRRHGYRPIDASRGEREAFGWVNPRAPLAEQFSWDDVVDGPRVFLATRRDRKAICKPLYRARLTEALAAYRQKKNTEKVGRQQRLAIEEALTAEMLKETSPTVSFTELVWDMASKEVYVGATSKALCERIADLFAQTFSVTMVPTFPALTGYDFILAQGLEDAFDAPAGESEEDDE